MYCPSVHNKVSNCSLRIVLSMRLVRRIACVFYEHARFGVDDDRWRTIQNDSLCCCLVNVHHQIAICGVSEGSLSAVCTFDCAEWDDHVDIGIGQRTSWRTQAWGLCTWACTRFRIWSWLVRKGNALKQNDAVQNYETGNRSLLCKLICLYDTILV